MGRSPLSSGRIRADGADRWVILPDGAVDEARSTVGTSRRQAAASPSSGGRDRQTDDALIAAILASVTRKR